ncbi:MAG: hypothetical protein D6748_06360 [Calditrichaeota bacterium]|nr:MAG: hypothetical protein D6748_06360 [Calditrichota bacterium]
MATVPQEFVTHLEFLGYEIEEKDEEGVIGARHEKHGYVFVKSYLDGVLLQQYFRINDAATRDRQRFLEGVNSLNSNARVTTYVAVGEGDTIALRMDAFYIGSYDRKHFALFLEAYAYDTFDHVVGNELIREFLE